MDFKKILTDIARAIVDTPDAVVVEETVNGDDIELVLTVAEDDTGMVIGRHGRIAKGCGLGVEDVNRLLKQFEQMKKMMKQLSGKNAKKMFGRRMGF